MHQDNPPDEIQSDTWEKVKTWWSDEEHKRLLEEQQHAQGNPPPPSVPSEQASSTSSSGWPLLRVDEKAQRIRAGEQELTRKIRGILWRLLLCLYRHQNDVCNNDLIDQEVWPENKGDTSDERIATNIKRLRKALGQKSTKEGYIETLTGLGYRLHTNGFNISEP